MLITRRNALQGLCAIPALAICHNESKGGVPAKPFISDEMQDVQYPNIVISTRVTPDKYEMILDGGRPYIRTFAIDYYMFHLNITKIEKDCRCSEHWQSVCFPQTTLDVYLLEDRLLRSPYRTASLFARDPYGNASEIPRLVLAQNQSQFTFTLLRVTYDTTPKTVRL
jgi:hypothetical protein